MAAKIHQFQSSEPLLKVNAFIVEGPKALVIVDTTLTMTDSKALYQQARSLKKPIEGIILTHGHPDHVAGAVNLASLDQIPIYSIQSVKKLMEDTEQAKHQQWSSIFGNEWIPKWIYPTEIVSDRSTVIIGGLKFNVIDIGSGGDCDANSVWLLEDETRGAFLGDLLYNRNHSYMNDGSILRWMGNLELLAPTLRKFDRYYVGHGPACDYADIDRQKSYFDRYCSQILAATGGTGIFNDISRKVFEEKMISLFPDYGCQFMVALSADRVGSELVGASHN
ncbi:MAG: MBL fold metallo-hydrolase [Chryseolinea sp.]